MTLSSKPIAVLIALASCAAPEKLEPDAAGAPIDPGPPCAVIVGRAELTSSTTLATDAAWLYAIDSLGKLLRAPLDGSEPQMKELADVGGIAHRILVDDRYLWIGKLGGTDEGLVRVDKATGATETIDRDLFLFGFAIDDTYVYWSTVRSNTGVVLRRHKDGGAVEAVVSKQSGLRVPSSIRIAGSVLYLVSDTSDADTRHDRIFTVDLVTREAQLVDEGLGTLDLLGPDDDGRFYRFQTSLGFTTVDRWGPQADRGPTIASWRGVGVGSFASEYASIGSGLFLAVPDLASALIQIPATGEPHALTADPFYGSVYGARFAIRDDVAYVFDGTSTIHRVPVAGGPYPWCAQ